MRYGVMAIPTYSSDYLRALVSDPSSSVQLKKLNKTIVLQASQLRNLKGAITGILNQSLCNYDSELDGLILGYQNVTCLGDKAPCCADSSQFSLQIEAEFYVFQPKLGNIYHGVVLKTSVVHVGCLLYNHFNVSLPILPQEGERLKTLTPQTEVTFVLKELNLASELPFFRGQLLGVKSKSTSKKEKHKNVPEMSLVVKHNADAVEKKMNDKHSKLTLKWGEGSECAKPDKKKQRLSLKQIQSTDGNKRETSEDDSDHIITPFQRPSENKKVRKPEEENPKLDKQTLLSMRESPLKGLTSEDDDTSDISFDFQKFLMEPTSGSGKSSQNSESSQSKLKDTKVNSPRLNVQSKKPGAIGSVDLKNPLKDDTPSGDDNKYSPDDFSKVRNQPVLLQTPTKQRSPQKVKTPTESLSKTKNKSQKSPRVDVQSKSPGGLDNRSQTPVKNVPAIDVSSSEDDKSSSEDSEDCTRKPVHTSPLKGNNPMMNRPPEVKAKPQKLALTLSLSKTDLQSKSRSQASKSVFPLNNVFRAVDSSSEDSSSVDSAERRKRPPQASPLKGKSPLAGSQSVIKTIVPKSPGGKIEETPLPKSSKNVFQGGDSSSDNDDKSFENSEDCRKKTVPAQVSTSPKKEKSTPSKVKAKSKKLRSALSLRKLDIHPSRGSQSVPPWKNVPGLNVLNPVENDKSSSETSDDEVKAVQCLPIRDYLPIATSTQKFPQKKSPNIPKAKLSVSSSGDSSDNEDNKEEYFATSTQKSPQKKSPNVPKAKLSVSSSGDSSDNEDNKEECFATSTQKSPQKKSLNVPKAKLSVSSFGDSSDNEDNKEEYFATSTQKSPQKKSPNVPKAKLSVSSSGDSSDDEDNKEDYFVTSTQKSPQKKTPNVPKAKVSVRNTEDSSDEDKEEELRVPSNTAAGKPAVSRPLPVVRCDNSASEDSDSDTNDKSRKLGPSRLVASAEATRGVAKSAEESTSEDTVARPRKKDEQSSDSEVEGLKTPAQTQPGRAGPGRLTASAEQSSSDSESDVPEAAAQSRPKHDHPRKAKLTLPEGSKPLHLSENTSSDSESYRKTDVPPLLKHSPTQMFSVKNAVLHPRKKSLLSQTNLDGSLQSRSPLASSTPTIESTKSLKKKIFLQSLKRSYPAETGAVEIEDPIEKKEKGSKQDELKLTDSGYKHSKEKKKKKKDDANLSKKDTKERTKVEKLDTLNLVLNKDLESNAANPKKHKKLKAKMNTQTALISNMQGGVCEPVKLSKHKDSSKTSAGVLPIEIQDDVRDLGKKQVEVVTSKYVDDQDGNGRKSDKRKFIELTEEQLERESTTRDRDLLRGESVPKRRKVISSTLDESRSVLDVSSKDGKLFLESHAFKSKKVSKNKKGDSPVKPESAQFKVPGAKFKEYLPVKAMDGQEGEIVTSVQLDSGGGNAEKNVGDQLSDEHSIRLCLDVSDNNSQMSKKMKKKEKKSKETDAVVTVESTRDVTPPVESIQLVSRKGKKGKERARYEKQTGSAAQCNAGKELKRAKTLRKEEKSSDDASGTARQPSLPLTVNSSASSRKEKTAEPEQTVKKSKNKEKQHFGIPESVREPSLSLLVDSAESSRKKKKISEVIHTKEEPKVEKKSKKKEKQHLAFPKLDRDLSPALYVASAVTSKKRKTTEDIHNEVEPKVEKKKEKHFFTVPELVREASLPVSIDSAEPSKKKKKKKKEKNSEVIHTHTKEEPVVEKKKDKHHFVVPKLFRDLSPASSVASAVSSKKKKTTEDIPNEVEPKVQKKKEKQLFAVPESVREPSPSLSVASSEASKKKKTSEVERKLKKKQHFAVPESVCESSLPLSIDSAESSKKNKNTSEMHTEEHKVKEKSKKEVKQIFAVPREFSPPLSVASTASSKRKLTKDLQIDKESKSEKKSKKKSKEKSSALFPELAGELSPPLSVHSSVSVHSKKTVINKDSRDVKVSVKKTNKKGKEHKVKAPMNQVPAHVGSTSVDFDDILQSMIRKTFEEFESEDDQQTTKK